MSNVCQRVQKSSTETRKVSFRKLTFHYSPTECRDQRRPKHHCEVTDDNPFGLPSQALRRNTELFMMIVMIGLTFETDFLDSLVLLVGHVSQNREYDEPRYEAREAVDTTREYGVPAHNTNDRFYSEMYFKGQFNYYVYRLHH